MVTREEIRDAEVEWVTTFYAYRVAAKAADNAARIKAAAAKAEKNAAKRHRKLRREYQNGN